MPTIIARSAHAADIRWSVALFVAIAASGAVVKYWWDVALLIGVLAVGYGGSKGALDLDSRTGAWIVALAAMAGMLLLVLANEVSRGKIRLHPSVIAATAIVAAQLGVSFYLFAALPGMKPLGLAVLLAATFGFVPAAAGVVIWWLAFRFIALPDQRLQTKHAERS